MLQRFQTTRWTLVIQASNADGTVRKQAMSELVNQNWYPLYSFLRHSGKSSERAEDLLQGFFVRVIEKNVLAGIRPHQRSRFRSFLLACLKNFVSNQIKYDQAAIRQGSQRILSIDFVHADEKFQLESKDSTTPQQAYDRAWAVEQIQIALLEVHDHWKESGKIDQFELLKGCLIEGEHFSRDQIATALNISKDTLKVRIHRLRGEFREALYRVVAQTLDDTELLEDEINQLFSAFRL